MSVVEHELKRHHTLADDVAKRRKEGKFQQAHCKMLPSYDILSSNSKDC